MKQIKETIPFKLLFSISIIGLLIISCIQKKQQKNEQGHSQIAEKSKRWREQKQLPIWTTSIPDSELVKGRETYDDGMVFNVSKPTITIYNPQKNNTGVAIIVFPGGGYNKLAIELEGSEICEWLSSIGVTGILLKYRVPASGHHYDKDCGCGKDPIKPLALQDAQRAVGMVRYHAKEWNIDSNRIGVMGFSAGGHLVADVSTNYRKRAYKLTDEIDKTNCRPDFGLSFFPGHMTVHAKHPYDLNNTSC